MSAVVHWHRGHCLRTAFVLTWFKIKERQASVYELLRTLKLLCRKGEIFYLGDNRLNSSDSRTYGACKDENVVGVVEEWSLKNRKLRSQFLKYVDKIKSIFN